MSFLYPLGFLALLGIPVLIIIYIIKNRYTEQVISSTYLWTLSNKFLKRRTPISMIAGIVSLILQIIIVIAVALAIAHPVFTVKNSANDFCFILDGSGSMNITYNDKTRLESGKEEIRKIINGTLKGSTYTILYADSDSPELVGTTSDKEQAFKYLDEIEPAYGNVSDTAALKIAQEYFTETPSVKIYYVTDVDYEHVENVEIINVAKNEQNFAVSDVKTATSGKKLTVSADVISYSGNAELSLGLYIDGSEALAATATVQVKAGEKTSFAFQPVADASEYKELKVSILNDDGLAMDSSVIVYSVNAVNEHRVLIVSDPHENGSEPAFFLTKMFDAINTVKLNYTIVGSEEYSLENYDNYELYVYDGYTPAELPSHGATWFINPTANAPATNFTYQGKMPSGTNARLEWTTDTSSSINPLFKEIDRGNPDEIYVETYVKCGITRDFDIILTHQKNPVLFTGTNAYGNRETVFAFDMNATVGVLTGDFLTLIRNLINYSFPSVLDETSFICGDILDINVLAGCDSITVTSPSGNIKSLDTDASVASYTITEVGVYKIVVKDVTGNSEEYSVFSALPEEERATSVTAQSFELTGEAKDGYRDGTYDDILYLFILIAVIAMADWVVYCYEQYQLR
ncbi:MAG: BatA and WFA domain-containing protein [Clostridia bacterium]|nr:BatA and WFA domain-containing protein [Clostridia bacterium]